MMYRPEDFTYDTPPRIMGSETEYNVQSMPPDMDLRIGLDDSSHYREDSRDDGREIWLENGARFYVDSGELVEYATPECLSAREVTKYELAGEAIVQRYADSVAKYTTSQDKQTATNGQAYKRSGYATVQPNPREAPILEEMTAGHHENYTTILIPEAFEAYSYDALKSFLSTRAVWAGAGLVTPKGYALSQKQAGIDFESSARTTMHGKKTALRRIESFNGLSQIEIRVGDGNMSQHAIARKFAMTSLVLRMIEHRVFPTRAILEDDLNTTFRRTSQNVEIIPRFNLTASGHQIEIARACIDFAEQFPDIPEEEIKAAYDVLEICEAIEHMSPMLEDAEILSDRVDWAAKLTYLRNHEHENITTNNLHAVYHDLSWENIATNGISRSWYDDKMPPYVTENEIRNSQIMPPPTRALGRVSILQSAAEHPKDIRWQRIDVDGELFRLDDPYAPYVTSSRT